MKVGGEVPRLVELRRLAKPMRLGLEHPRAELQLPEDLERPPLGVVVEADQLNRVISSAGALAWAR